MSNARVAKIVNWLRVEGYAANAKPDGEISFKYNRISMFVDVEDKDPDYCKAYMLSTLDQNKIAIARKACENLTLNM